MSLPAASSKPLPPTLHAIYQTYKIGTVVLINWLVLHGITNGDTTQSKPTRLPVLHILGLAEKIAQKSILPPKSIKDAFNVVLVYRRRLTEYYEKNEDAPSQATAEATARHKHFNETLAKAYDILVPRTNRPVSQERGTATPPKEQTRETDLSNNRFNILSEWIEHEPDHEEMTPMLPSDENEKPIAQPSAIEDDPIEDVIALHAYILEVENTILKMKDIWVSVAKGEIHLTLAGWLTNFGFQMIRILARDYAFVPASHWELICRYEGGKEDVLHADPAKRELFETGNSPEDAISDFDDFITGLGLIWPFHTVEEFGACLQHDEGFMNALDRQVLYKYFDSRAEEIARIEAFELCQNALDERCANGTLDEEADNDEWRARFKKFFGSWALRVNFVLRGAANRLRDDGSGWGDINWHKRLPLCDEVQFLMSMPEGHERSQLIFGLHLLLGSCTAFLWSGKNGDFNQASCRIQALKFAKEVEASARKVILATKDEVYIACAAFHPFVTQNLKRHVERLGKYQKQSIFDLYSQSPWVCGSQMAFFLDFAQDMGFALLNMRGYFGGILHLYNMLQQCEVPCPELPVVEELCRAFQQEVFLDKIRPTRNFTSIFRRYVGGTPVSKGDGGFCIDCPTTDHDKRDPYRDDVRISGQRLSLFQNQFMDVYYGDEHFWEIIANSGEIVRSHKKLKTNGVKNMHKVLAEHSLPDLLLNTKTYVGREFVGLFPLARVNLLELYLTCLLVWKDITINDEAKVRDERKNHPLCYDFKFRICCAVKLFDTTAQDVDKKIQNKKLAATLKDHSAMALMRDSLVKVFGDKKVEDFYWKEI